MSRQARVGLLVLAGVGLFLLALFAIANRSFLFSDTFSVKARFNSVANLQPGASVQYQGYNVGRVESIQLPKEPGGPLTVAMAIKQEAQSLVNSNTKAQIKTSGLVGNQIIVLVTPPAQQVAAEELESGDFIEGVEPFDIYEITDQALAAVDTFATVAVEAQQIMQDIQEGEGTLGKFIYDPALFNSIVASTDEAQRTLSTVSESAERLTDNIERATERVNTILTKASEGEGTIARALNDPAVYETFLSTADTLQNVAGDLRSVTQSAENATTWAALGAFRFAELMEAGKHTWLFKRYFEERGYWERAPFETRELAITESKKELQAERRKLEQMRQRLQAWEEQLEERNDPPRPAQEAASDTLAAQETPEQQALPQPSTPDTMTVEQETARPPASSP